MTPQHARPDRELFTVGHQHVIHVPPGRGEALQIHLASHGIHALVSRGAETRFDRLEIEEPVDPEALRALVDHWEG